MKSTSLWILVMKTATLIGWIVSITTWNHVLLTTGCRGQGVLTSTPPMSRPVVEGRNVTSIFDLVQLSNDNIRPLMIATADFEKPLTDIDLLALKVDRSLMEKLDQWLAKYGIQLPDSLIETIEQMDLCPERASEGMRRE